MNIDKERIKDQLQSAAERRTNPLKKERYSIPLSKTKRKGKSVPMNEMRWTKWLGQKYLKT